MAEIITMPRLSDTMEEGTVVKWHKNVGDKVSEGDVIAEIETDKAIQEFESEFDGTLLYQGANENERNTRKRCKMFKALVVKLSNKKEELM